jgi:hypothetical protein
MGLDMYLSRKIYVGANYDFNGVQGTIKLTRKGYDRENETVIEKEPIKINFKKVTEITEEAMYWRKANAIHNWFVEQCQEGRDECQEVYVPREKLEELMNLCNQAVKEKDGTILAPTAGFFFGSTDTDEYYFEMLKDTAKELKKILKDDRGDFYYQSSW